MRYTFQKSFRLEEGNLVTLKSGKRILTPQVDSTVHAEGFAATVSANYWLSIVSPEALCSFATEPGIRAIIGADTLLSRKGVEVTVPSYQILALASDYPVEAHTLRELFPSLTVLSSPDDLRKLFRVTTKREARLALRASTSRERNSDGGF